MEDLNRRLTADLPDPESPTEELAEELIDAVRDWMASGDIPPAWVWRIIEDAFVAEPAELVFDLLRLRALDTDDEELSEELASRLVDQIRNSAPPQIWGYHVIRNVAELMP